MKDNLRRIAALLAALMLLVPAAAPGEGTAAPGTTPPAAVTTSAVLKSGSKGDAVKQLQLRLSELGYDPGTADGIFGNGTKTAVKEFQQRNGLKADGIAGQQTLERLYSEKAIGIPLPEQVDVLGGDLPMLVNKTHPMGDLYPADLVLLKDELDSSLVRIKYDDIKAVREVAEALQAMLEAANADGMKKWQISAGYRSRAQQEREMESKITAYMRSHKDWSRTKARNAALRTVAEPGTSEHQLGLAIDINIPGTSFAGTKQCKWLHEHCWEYGFIVRYTADKKKITGYDAEAWHIRYVGVDHAMRIRELGLCLEEYLDGIAGGTIEPPEKIPAGEDGGTEQGEEAAGGGETEEIEEIILPDM